jgi:glucosamine--fructose-6-phosphate aminotransferase (isomerizing)
MRLRVEIFDQPADIRRLLERQFWHVRSIAGPVRQSDVSTVFLTARGTSNHAGLYAKYLWRIRNGFPVALAAPSTFTLCETSLSAFPALISHICK